MSTVLFFVETPTVAMITANHLRGSFSRGTFIALTMMSLVQIILGCFPVDDVLKTSCSWTMAQSLETHYRVDVCANYTGAKEGSRMTFTTKDKGEENQWHWDCLKILPNPNLQTNERVKYLVKRGNSKKTLGFQCVTLTSLTSRVVRLESSELFNEEKDVKCTTLTAKEQVLVASEKLEPLTCPITGGYQVLMKLSDNILNNKKCLEKTATYKPHLQFRCDQARSSHVLADFGSSCLPGDVQMSTAMQGESMAHLECVDSWQEYAGTSSQFTSVLLRMQGTKNTFWCLSFELVVKSSHSSVVSPHEVLYKSLLTFDGRCVQDMNGQHSVPSPMTMFGHLAAFIPGDDMKCKEASYLKHCEAETVDICQETTDCPKTCGRCLEASPQPPCLIPDKLQGTWQSFSSEKKTLLAVYPSMVTSPKQGDFKCLKYEEDASEEGDKFSLVQIGEHATCMLYHTCGTLKTLAPGLLSYRIIPTKRDDDGKLLSCLDTERAYRMNMVPTQTTTMVQPNKLEETPCNMMTTMRLRMHNSGSDCRLTIHECQGSCHTFNISLEEESCDNKTAEQLGLMTQHTCMALIAQGERGIRLTRSPDTKQFLCWIQLSTSVFMLDPENCSHEQVELIMDDPTGVPNPIHMLEAVVPQNQKNSQGRNSAVRFATTTTYPLLAFLTIAWAIL